MGEKAWLMPPVTIHRHRERFKVGKHFMQKTHGENHLRAFVTVVEGSEV
jgi:hypothetical protein